MLFSARHVINGITLYRLVATPLLVFFLLTESLGLFKWMLAISFFTDAIDGWLARKFNVTSILGAKLDSIGDDLTVFAGILGMILYKPEFLRAEIPSIILVIILFFTQMAVALIRYRKTTGFHTYLAKIAAVFQGVFLVLVYFLPEPVHILFHATIFITAADLTEEIIIVILLREWQANVRGLFWVLKRSRQTES